MGRCGGGGGGCDAVGEVLYYEDMYICIMGYTLGFGAIGYIWVLALALTWTEAWEQDRTSRMIPLGSESRWLF